MMSPRYDSPDCKIAEKHWSAVITKRDDNIRLISVRRSRDEEIAIYESQDLAGTDAKRVNVDFPAWMVGSLDREARRLGVTRQSLIKLWLAEKLRADRR